LHPDNTDEPKEAVMNIKRIWSYLMVCSLVVIMQPLHGLAQNSSAPKTRVHQTTEERDGQRDFDPLIGSWKVHWKRRLHPLTGSTTWVEFDGIDVYRKIWDGRADLEEKIRKTSCRERV
jgi:hypothetical protein